MCLSIINLLPHLRNSPDVGCFFYGLDESKYGDAKHKESIRNFLFRDCLIKELNVLAEGFYYDVGETKYFVQARLILHCLDTKALTPMICCQGVGAKAGCPICR